MSPLNHIYFTPYVKKRESLTAKIWKTKEKQSLVGSTPIWYFQIYFLFAFSRKIQIIINILYIKLRISHWQNINLYSFSPRFEKERFSSRLWISTRFHKLCLLTDFFPKNSTYTSQFECLFANINMMYSRPRLMWSLWASLRVIT